MAMSTYKGLILTSEKHSQPKESRLFEYMNDLRTGVGNVQNEPGTFCARK